MTSFKVCVRKRPCKNISDIDVVKTTQKNISIFVEKTKVNLDKYIETKIFEFERVYSEKDETKTIYLETIKKNVELKKNFISYTFGETGSGKTHTLLGPDGLIPLTLHHITSLYDVQNSKISISSYEIYNDQMYDMLNNRNKLIMLEFNNLIMINNLTWSKCDHNSIIPLINLIKKNRSVGVSSENSQSSRSHCVVHIKIDNLNYIFVDLAGSERGIKSEYSSRKGYYEMAGINMDIFHLKECIRSMKNNSKYIPFRSSRLTMALRESFYDNYNSLILVTISPEKSNITETLNILNCAEILKNIKRKHKKSKQKQYFLPSISENPSTKKNNPSSFDDYNNNNYNNQNNFNIFNKKNIQEKYKENIQRVGTPITPTTPITPIIPIIPTVKKQENIVLPPIYPQIIKNTVNLKKDLVQKDGLELNKKKIKLLDIVLKVMKKCTEYIELTNSQQVKNVDNFGNEMAEIITDQVCAIKQIDKDFGKKFVLCPKIV